MASLLSLPNEALLLILRNCDTLSQLSSLTLTCRQIRSVYSHNIHSIWCQVGRRSIPSFEDAVITSRATRIALEHFDKGQFPPAPFPLDQLPTSAQKICLEDIQSVLDWNHFVTCIEIICLHETAWGGKCASSMEPVHEFAPSAQWNTWRERFHRSMYQSFLMGAVLCRTYQEPLVPITNRLKNLLDKWTEQPTEDTSRLHQADVDHLRTFPVFNLEAYETHEPIYGPLAEFFVRQTQPDVHDELFAPTMYPADATPDDSLDRSQANAMYAAMVQCMLSTMTMWEDYLFFTDEATDDLSGRRTLRTVGPNSFYPEEMSMPVHAQDATHTLLQRIPLLTEEKGNSSRWTGNAQHLFGIIDAMYGFSEEPSVEAEDQGTPYPPLQVFQFIARRYFGLKFTKDAFVNGVGTPSDLFVSHPNAGDIYLGNWPCELPPMFEIVNGER